MTTLPLAPDAPPTETIEPREWVPDVPALTPPEPPTLDPPVTPAPMEENDDA